MKQHNWKYQDQKGKNHFIGLMHGVDSGNLIVHCNSKVIVIDFQILFDKTYSFMLNEDLCTISIKKEEDNTYKYHLEVENPNKVKAVNGKPKEKPKASFLRSNFFYGIFTLVFFAGIILLTSYITKNSYEVNHTSIYLNQSDSNYIRYTTQTKDGKFLNVISLENKKEYLNTPIFPLENGDEFYLDLSDKNQPKLDFNRPTRQQINSYKIRAIKVHAKNNPAIHESNVECFINNIYEYGGLKALAHVYHQNTPPSESSSYDAVSYQHFVADQNFKAKVTSLCGFVVVKDSLTYVK